jgi:hypothetical protein
VGGVNTFERRHPGGMLHLQTTGWRNMVVQRVGWDTVNEDIFFCIYLVSSPKK